jgi:hypothetical protein
MHMRCFFPYATKPGSQEHSLRCLGFGGTTDGTALDTNLVMHVQAAYTAFSSISLVPPVAGC